MTVVIGSQTDVPDSGDPIVSPWYQDTAKKIVHVFASTAARDAWTSPPNGAVCQAPAGTWYERIGTAWVPVNGLVFSESAAVTDVSSSAIGTRDIQTFLTGVTFGFPVTVVATWHGIGGFSAGTAWWAHDIQNLITGAIFGSSTSYVSTVAGSWASSTVTGLWRVATGGSCAWKCRQNINNNGGGTVHVGGTVTSMIYAAP